MSASQLRAAAFAYENSCDCCGNGPDTSDREAAIRDALTADPCFIGEAIGSGDLSNLVEAFTTKDPQRCWDAVHDLVADYLKDEEARARSALRAKLFSQQNDIDALEHLAAVHGVAA